MEFNTGSNERGHKVVKRAARLTQRCEDTFDSQTALRMEELLQFLHYAKMEMKGYCLWDYYHHRTNSDELQELPDISKIMAAEIYVVYDEEHDINTAFIGTKTKKRRVYTQKMFCGFCGWFRR